jgi:hypothetical protein
VGEYYEKTLDRFTGWITHQDTKAAFALVILGIGSADLLDHAARLSDAHQNPSRWGSVATVAFWLAVAAGASAIALAWLTVIPRVRSASGSSVYFFGTVASYRTAREYEAAVERLTDDERKMALAEQVWELAKHAATKARYARLAYVAVFVFLLLWGAARVSLSLAT